MAVHKVPMNKVRAKYTKLPFDRKWLILGLLAFIVSFFFKINVIPLIFLVIFCIANSLLLSIDRYVNAPLDLEFSTFSAVLMTLRYGLEWGIAVAILTKVAAILYNKNVRVDHLFMTIGYVLAAVFASWFSGLGILLLGIVVTLLVNLYVVFVSKYVTMLSNYEILMYGVSNSAFNIVLFIGFSQLLLAVMI